MKVLITGVEGFIGSHLADFMINKGDVIGIAQDINDNKNIKHLENKIELAECDINDKQKITSIIKKSKPEIVFHMAAQSFVMPSWKDPEQTFRTNIFGTFYILEALRQMKGKPIVSVACSSAEYGLNYKNEIPTKETKEFRPSSPYAVSKVTTDMLAYLYWRAYGMKTIRLRFFNTTGPRKTGSAIAEWAQGIAEIEKGKKNELRVGNLTSIVDYTDVRDSIKAMWLLTKKRKFGEAYNICTGKGYKMKYILDVLKGLSTGEIKVVVDPNKIRPSDDPVFIGDNSKLRKLGWKPKIPLEETLKDTLNYWRKMV